MIGHLFDAIIVASTNNERCSEALLYQRRRVEKYGEFSV